MYEALRVADQVARLLNAADAEDGKMRVKVTLTDHAKHTATVHYSRELHAWVARDGMTAEEEEAMLLRTVTAGDTCRFCGNRATPAINAALAPPSGVRR